MRAVSTWRTLSLVGACLFASGLAASAPAPPLTLPDTPPAKRLRELLDVVNSGDRAALAAYARTAFVPSMLRPDSSIVDFLHGHHESLGGLDARRVLESGGTQIVALVQGRAKPDAWLRYVVGAEAEPPHRISGVFTFRASPAMAEEGSGPIAEADLPSRFRELVDRIAAEGRFSGSVCLARDGKVLVSRAWGEADRESHARNTPETRFGIASVGKLFTAVAIARLVEAGKLRYDDPAAKHVPDWLPPGGGAITVEHLLTHTSGLGDYLAEVVNDRSGRAYDRLEDYRRFARDARLEGRPGETFRYSNTGFVVLGAIVEKLSGRRWDEWYRDSLFTPTGMSRTRAMRPERHDPAMAAGYHQDERGHSARTDSLLAGRGTPAGGGVSTAEDLARFAGALAGGRLVPRAALERMLTPRIAMSGTGKQYGYGITVAAGRDGQRVWGHEGGFPGVGALVEVHDPGGYVLAVLSNTTAGAMPIGDAWRDLLRRTRPAAAKD